MEPKTTKSLRSTKGFCTLPPCFPCFVNIALCCSHFLPIWGLPLSKNTAVKSQDHFCVSVGKMPFRCICGIMPHPPTYALDLTWNPNNEIQRNMRLDPRWNSTVIIEPYRTIYRQLSRVLRNHPLFRRCSPLLPSMLDKIPKVTLLAALASTRRPSRWWAKPSGMSCRRVHPIPYWIYLVFWVISNAIKKDISRYSYTFKFFDFAVLSSNKLANPTEGYIKWPRELHADLRDVPVLTLQKLLHFTPRWAAKSWALHRKMASKASLSWIWGIRTFRVSTNHAWIVVKVNLWF